VFGNLKFARTQVRVQIFLRDSNHCSKPDQVPNYEKLICHCSHFASLALFPFLYLKILLQFSFILINKNLQVVACFLGVVCLVDENLHLNFYLIQSTIKNIFFILISIYSQIYSNILSKIAVLFTLIRP